MSLSQQTKAASQPGGTEGGIYFAGAVKSRQCFGSGALLQQYETAKSVRGRQPRRKAQCAVQGCKCAAVMSEREFQLRHSRVGKTELRSQSRGLARCRQGAWQIRVRLE